MATFVLVHGTGHGGWCWQKLLLFLAYSSGGPHLSETLYRLCHALAGFTLLPPSDPEIINLATIVRDATPALRDMLTYGQGQVHFYFDGGRMIMSAETRSVRKHYPPL